MRIAVLADVHANATALEAVLRQLARESFDAVVCLGDLVGYNAEPARCVAHVRGASDVVVAGNHDRDIAVGSNHPGTNGTAQAAGEWTRSRLDDAELHYLASLPSHVVSEHGFVAAHGSYLSDVFVTGYVTSTMLEENLRAVAERPGWPVVALCGHTHIPLLGFLEGDRCQESALTEPVRWPARSRAVLVNPGSVGQPRDGDPRAAFALVDLDTRTAEIRRVPYDVERAAQLIHEAGLPETLADRLREGR